MGHAPKINSSCSFHAFFSRCHPYTLFYVIKQRDSLSIKPHAGLAQPLKIQTASFHMFKFLLVILLAGGGYLGWEKYEKNQREQTPLEEINSCIEKNPIDSKELLLICGKYPEQVATALKNRRITVSGVLQKALVKGVQSHDLILDLEGSNNRKVTFTSDVKRFTRMNSGSGASGFKFQKVGREIIVVQKVKQQVGPSGNDKGAGEGANAAPVYTQETKVAFRELEPITLDGVFEHLSKTAVHIEWRQPTGF